jgi:hypothetical protein
MSYIDYVLQESKVFLDDFIHKKIDDICNHLTLFYNYLSIPREGFKIVKKPFWIGTTKCIKILNDKERKKLKVNNLRCERPVINKYFCDLHVSSKLEDNITSEIISTKRLNSEMVTYLFNDIYNCKNFTTTTNIVEFVGREKQHIFTEIYKAIDDRLTSKSVKEILYYYLRDNEVIIENEVEKLIIKYVAICIYNMIFIDLDEDNLDKKYFEMQQYVLTIKRNYVDYNLESENYNIGLQSFVYIITALMDWLELDDVSTDEVETAFNIILYSGYKDRIEKIKTLNRKEIQSRMSDTIFTEKVDNYKSNISLAFRDLKLYVDEAVSELILNYILLLTNIYYLDENCELYFSTTPEVQELHSLLSKMFEGCYSFNISYDSLGKFNGITVSGKLRDNYAKYLGISDINLEKHINLFFGKDINNFMMVYTTNSGIVEDIYISEEQILENKNKYLIEMLELFKSAVNQTTMKSKPVVRPMKF